MVQNYIPFTEEMKKDYTILVPTMLPMHFRMIISVMKTYGYNMELLESSGEGGVEELYQAIEDAAGQMRGGWDDA